MKYLSVICCIIFSLWTQSMLPQETTKVKKIKIGKFEYSISIDKDYDREEDVQYMNYYIRLGDKEQYISSALQYRNRDSSPRYKYYGLEHIEGTPLNPRIFYNDREVLGAGTYEIDYKNHVIINKFKNYVKDYKDQADSTKYVMKQMKNGFFENILGVEYKDGKEKVFFKK